jgi:MFS transporter, DHA2 family, multidrug resistance protein
MYGAIQNDVGGTLGASADELPWATIGYNTFYWVVIILTPWLVDRFGRRIVFGAGHLAFGLLTIYLAGAAWFDGFVFARCLEGLAQGTFFVCSVTTTLTLFPPKLRGLAYSVFGVTSLSGAASGAFIGGWFLDHAFWRGRDAGLCAFSDVRRYRHPEAARGARC